MRKILIATISLASMVLLSGCNKQVVDFDYKFDKAIISLPNGEVVEGKVDSWRDYEDGEQLQITIDGITYLVSSFNAVLIK